VYKEDVANSSLLANEPNKKLTALGFENLKN